VGKKNKTKKTSTLKPLAQSYSTTLVDIIILARGRFDLLARCLQSIPGAFPEVATNVIVVDNASEEVVESNNVREFYREQERLYSNLTVIRSDRNLGFPAGCNLGARRKSSPILFFLNSDVILDEDSGTKLLLAMDNPDTGVAGMKLRFASSGEYTDAGLNPNIRPAGKLQHIGMSVNVNGDVYHPFLGWDHDHPRVDQQNITFAVTGAALMIRRPLFVKIGGFFEGYGLGTFEDVDLCMAAREAGKQVVVVPSAGAVHFTGATVEQLQAQYPLHQNANIFRSRWMEKLIWWDFFIL